MKTKIKPLPNLEAELYVEIESGDMQSFFKEAAKEISKNYPIKGFRPGNAGVEAVLNELGRDAFFDHAAKLAVRATLLKAISSNNLEPIAYLNEGVQVQSIGLQDPFCYKVKMAVYPEVKLPDYKEIKIEKSNQSDKEKTRNEAINKIEHEAKLQIPQILKDQEVVQTLEEIMRSLELQGLSLEDYLLNLNMNMRDFKHSLEEGAERKVKLALIFREIAKRENIQVKDEEIEVKVADFLMQFGNPPEALKSVDITRLRDYIKLITRNEKVIKLIEDNIVFV